MDIHRSRFVPFPPSAINALAFSHPEADDNNKDPECLRLAVGRANGNIEIWNPSNGVWLQEKVFYGGKDRSVEGLVWTQEPVEKDNQNKIIPGRLRLFSIGYSSSITEWDLATGLPARHSDGNHSEVWCFAAQPRVKTPANDGESQQNLVAGCADGTVVLLSTADDDLRFEKFVSRSSTKKARALSIAYKDRHIVLAGFADSMIRVFDTRNGNVLRNISLGSGSQGGPKEILVWKVKCLPNGDFVSGDSTGDIRTYNGKNYSQMERISGHEADILDLAVSRDGTMIFSAGMDRRTCFYSSKKSAATRGQGGKWRKVSHKRYHEHDVKAMATYEGNKLSIVVSGGIDTQPVVVPLRQFGKELSRGLPALPHTPPLISAPNARLMISWWNSELRIWRVKSQDDRTEKPKVVARLALQGEENVTSASITQDGGLLAVATAHVVKLFRLFQPQSGAGSGLRIRKIEVPTAVGAKIVRLSADGKWLTLVTATNEVLLLRILPPEDEEDLYLPLDKIVRLKRHPRPSPARHPLDGSSGEYCRSIVQAEFSSDGKVFAVADLAGYIDTWVVEGHEDPTAPELEFDASEESDSEVDDEEDEDATPKGQVMFSGQRWISNPSGHLIPRLDSTPVLLSFQPNTEQPEEPKGNPGVHPTRNNPHPHSHEIPNIQYRLLVVSADHRLNLFDVLTGRLSEWSRRNPPSSYPSPYRLLDLPAKGCIWDISEERQRLWLYGEKWLFMFDLSNDLPIPELADVDMVDIADEQEAGGSKKRKRDVLKDTFRKNNTGAGDIIPEKDAPVTKLRKFTSAQVEDGSAKQAWTDANDARKNMASEDELDDSHQSLATLRRAPEQNGEEKNGEGQVAEGLDPQKSNEPWWNTLKYRPILGMVPIGEAEEGQPLEVVLVERPSWDLDLPPKFVGIHEQ